MTEYHEYMPRSFTKYRNKIGLVDGKGEFIINRRDIALVFPYKDCVLEGGQTRDDQRRQEVFFNETIAREEITCLLDPKVLVGARRFTPEGVEPALDFHADDNLIVKGNNLITLASLQKRFGNRIKMAYWDIPYNTGSDSFGYNDRFSLSTWLVFIKNRVEQTLPLLQRDGVILIQCSFHNFAYLKVLLDEIIGNHVMTFNVLVRHPDRVLTADKQFNDVVEYILVYSKSPDFKMPRMVQTKTVNDYKYVVNELTEGKPIEFDGRRGRYFLPTEYELLETQPSDKNFKIVTVRGSIREKVSSGRFYVKHLQPLEKTFPPKTLFKVEGIGDDAYNHRYFYLPPCGNKNGAYLQGMPLSSSVTYKPYPNFLDFVQSYNTVNSEGEVEFRNGKKPEDLIEFLMNIFTDENDIVLDAFAGSGTTAAVAHKLKRRFITIEQMNYIDDITVKRIRNAGASFVYCSLARLNQAFVDELERASDHSTIQNILERVINVGYIDYRLEVSKLDEEEFAALTLEEQKQLVMEIIDKNMLYVNRYDIDDVEFAIADADKSFTHSFYNGGER
ncbi:MAG: site-specific DNA-methyltransferase [Selenomonadaceae bacterium]|nr:site-specific DNA-methyltransferase [Selenomonadaceae bacterium]